MINKNFQEYSTPDMISIIQERLINAISASNIAFQSLKGDLHLLPHDLWDDEQCLKDHEIQIEQLLLIRNQCEFWRKNSYLTPSQKIELLQLEGSLTECEKISQNIVFILHEKLK